MIEVKWGNLARLKMSCQIGAPIERGLSYKPLQFGSDGDIHEEQGIGSVCGAFAAH